MRGERVNVPRQGGTGLRFPRAAARPRIRPKYLQFFYQNVYENVKENRKEINVDENVLAFAIGEVQKDK